MSDDYRIERDGSTFIVIDDAGEEVGTYGTLEAADKDIERCKKEDAMWETAKALVDTAIKTHMQMYNVDRETSHYWISSAT